MLPEGVNKIICLEHKTLLVGLHFKSQGTKLQLSCKLKEV